MTKIEHMKEAEILDIAKKMFYGGFLFLPWLWLVNWLYMQPAIKHRPELPSKIKWYANTSLILCTVFFVCLTTWFVIYSVRWPTMGLAGIKLGVVIPKG